MSPLNVQIPKNIWSKFVKDSKDRKLWQEISDSRKKTIVACLPDEPMMDRDMQVQVASTQINNIHSSERGASLERSDDEEIEL